MIEIIHQGLKGLIVQISNDFEFYCINFGNEFYDLNKWLHKSEIELVN